MPAGSYAAGSGFAGADPVAAWSDPPKVIQTSNAALWDLSTRTVSRDEATGLVKRIHWVDQAVALALGVPLGSLPSSPNLGHRLRLIKRAAGPQLEAQVVDAVNLALADLLERRDISLISIVVNTTTRSQIVVAVSYVNLRLNPRSNQNTETISAAF